MIELAGDIINGVHYFEDYQSEKFEKPYTKLREEEARIFSDERVKALPRLVNHNLSEEWQLREESCSRFLKYLKDLGKITILEIGCGNGWFSNKLSEVNDNVVFGQDINVLELEQAARCFEKPNLKFLYTTCFKLLADDTIDLVVFNASLQYFKNPNSLLDLIATKLKSTAQIHVLDTPIYHTVLDAQRAKMRTKHYYMAQGHGELEGQYFHHDWESLDVMKVHYKPTKLKRILGAKNPFPWFQIKA